MNWEERIEGERVYLRTLGTEDATERYCSWLNDPAVNQYLETRSATVADLERYIGEKVASDDALFFGIFVREDGLHIGNVKLEPIDATTQTADFSIMIGDKEWWGKGIGTEVTNLIVAFAFGKLAMDRVELGVISENKAAIKVYEKAGFATVRVEKDALPYGDARRDKVVMSISRGGTQ